MRHLLLRAGACKLSVAPFAHGPPFFPPRPQVYRALCKPLDEIVAVKRVNLDGANALELATISRETALMRRFHHPNILALHTSFVHGAELWIVMPFMGAGSVRSIMMQHYPTVRAGQSAD
jgi:serine/threonine protein kinase